MLFIFCLGFTFGLITGNYVILYGFMKDSKGKFTSWEEIYHELNIKY
jgi:hypothetical protein